MKKEISLSILSGILLTCSFPRINAYWLAWFALLPLLFSLKDLTTKKAFYIGLVAGVTHYLTLLYWLVPTMNIYGHLPIWMGCILILLLALYLSLYYALYSVILTNFCKKSFHTILLAPLVLVSLEYIRTFLFSGFPWELLGYSQFKQLHVIQISDITGVYGVSFLIALTNGSLLLILLHVTKKKWQGFWVSKKEAIGAAVITILIMAMVLLYGNIRIKSIDREKSGSETAKISVIQGNIDQSVKWEHDYQKETILKYLGLSFSTLADSPDLIVWPETATPFYYSSEYGNKHLTKLIQDGIKKADTSFLFGSPSYARDGMEIHYYNSAYFLNPLAQQIGKYNKIHLVPYGEYVPLKKYFPFINKLVAQVGDFKTGKKGSTINWKNNKIGIQICFEVIFPDLARSMAANGANLFINITNDAWFGTSNGPYQHFSMTVFRAVENKRALVRSANTGISGFIDPLGRIMNTTALSTEAAQTQTIPLMKIKTIYTIIGDLFAIMCLVTSLLFIVFYILKKNLRRSICLQN